MTLTTKFLSRLLFPDVENTYSPCLVKGKQLLYALFSATFVSSAMYGYVYVGPLC